MIEHFLSICINTKQDQEHPMTPTPYHLLGRTGFASRGVFVMDGSRRSAHGNAYFTGLGRAKRASHECQDGNWAATPEFVLHEAWFTQFPCHRRRIDEPCGPRWDCCLRTGWFWSALVRWSATGVQPDGWRLSCPRRAGPMPTSKRSSARPTWFGRSACARRWSPAPAPRTGQK